SWYVEAHTNLGTVLTKLGQLDEALTHLRQALVLDPTNVDALICIGHVLHMLDRPEEALAQCTKLASLPLGVEALNNVAQLLVTLNRREEALGFCDRALAIRPDDVMILANRANVLAGLKRFDEALAGYAKAQALQPDNADANFGESLVRLRL